MKVAIRRLVLAMLFVGAGIIIGSFIVSRNPALAFDLEAAFPVAGNPFEECVTPTADEMALFSIAVQTLEAVKDRLSALGIGAEKFLGDGLYRDGVRVCDPGGVYDRVAHLSVEHLTFKYRLVEYQLKLAARFGEPDPYIVEAIAKSAFNGSRQPSETFANRDIRPMARSVLAGFREKAAKYATTAYDQMSANDSLGTGAAQVAAAAGHPLALNRIERLMTDTLSALPEGGVVPWDTKNRLYELAYAFTLVGERGKMHLAPLRQLMTMRVQSRAPPFGMIELQPKRMCDLLAHIVGINSADVQTYPYCADDTVPYDS